MNLQRLRGRKTVERLKRHGKRFRGKHMTITVQYGKPMNEKGEGIFVGTAASIKTAKNAVKRNRMRRRCREALRTTVREHKNIPSCQLLIIPRSSSLACDFEEIMNDIDSFMRYLLSYAPRP